MGSLNPDSLTLIKKRSPLNPGVYMVSKYFVSLAVAGSLALCIALPSYAQVSPNRPVLPGVKCKTAFKIVKAAIDKECDRAIKTLLPSNSSENLYYLGCGCSIGKLEPLNPLAAKSVYTDTIYSGGFSALAGTTQLDLSGGLIAIETCTQQYTVPISTRCTRYARDVTGILTRTPIKAAGTGIVSVPGFWDK